MGFLRSMRDLSSMGRQMERAQPPVADRLADAVAGMQASQATLASLADSSSLEAELRAEGSAASATIASVTGGQGTVDGAPVLVIELVVQAPGRLPMPATVHTVVPQHLLHRMAPGATVPVLVDASGARAVLDVGALGAG